jgi:hypothetical protein
MALRESDLQVEMLVRSAPRVRMPRVLRTMVFGVSALLWLSGALWLLVHFAFPQRNEFGPLPNPWEPGLLRAHGILAVGAVFLLGWLAAEHIPAGWSRGGGARVAWNRSARRRAGALAAQPRGALKARGARLAGLRGCRYHTRPFERAAACAPAH